MKKFKKMTLMAGSYIAVASIAIGGTMAFMQYQTNPEINTFSNDKVEIEQIELERSDSGILKEFEDSTMYPAVTNGEQAWQPVSASGDTNSVHYAKVDDNELITGIQEGAWNGMWDVNKVTGAKDKMVFVKNTSKEPVYYRTIIAVETVDGKDTYHLNTNGNALFEWDKSIKNVNINGKNCDIWIATYLAELEGNEVSRPSLLQVALDSSVDNDVMETMGGDFEVFVVSQAVQTENFTDAKTALNTAFEEITADNVASFFEIEDEVTE